METREKWESHDEILPPFQRLRGGKGKGNGQEEESQSEGAKLLCIVVWSENKITLSGQINAQAGRCLGTG